MATYNKTIVVISYLHYWNLDYESGMTGLSSWVLALALPPLALDNCSSAHVVLWHPGERASLEWCVYETKKCFSFNRKIGNYFGLCDNNPNIISQVLKEGL